MIDSGPGRTTRSRTDRMLDEAGTFLTARYPGEQFATPERALVAR